MADTRRSLADLQTLLADNAAGDISAQDVRDFLVSVFNDHAICQGRLTTETGVAVSTSDRTSQSQLYFTPHDGNLIGLYDGTSWKVHSFTEISASFIATSGVNHDIFVYDNSGTPALTTTAWTNDTTRATAIVLQDGVYVKSGATTRRYVGTVRASGTNVTEDSISKRFVWNYYNRMRKPMSVIDTTDSWTYTTATWRAVRAQTSNRVEYVVGVSQDPVTAEASSYVTNSGATTACPGVGIDSTSVNSAQIVTGSAFSYAATPGTARYRGYPGLGYHYLQWLEISGAVGTTTWYGDAGLAYVQSGMRAEIMG